MKKILPLFALPLLLAALLVGCGKEKLLPALAEFSMEENAATARGVKAGDGADAFLSAYGDYSVFVSIGGGDYRLLDPADIPFEAPLRVLLPSFFVDGAAVEPANFCAENGIKKEELIRFLTDEAYLSAHEVSYRYLLFTWKEGKITDIRSDSMDYNKDAAIIQPLMR